MASGPGSMSRNNACIKGPGIAHQQERALGTNSFKHENWAYPPALPVMGNSVSKKADLLTPLNSLLTRSLTLHMSPQLYSMDSCQEMSLEAEGHFQAARSWDLQSRALPVSRTRPDTAFAFAGHSKKAAWATWNAFRSDNRLPQSGFHPKVSCLVVSCRHRRDSSCCSMTVRAHAVTNVLRKKSLFSRKSRLRISHQHEQLWSSNKRAAYQADIFVDKPQ
ncbi:hypothetical protein Hamer_G017284 [Homarus americanus]|uniref:Uncharacterized protein n=1 Tax=Homarus americanus TaxID=6706 RepID=A0A8J5JZV3_HOMAM|nr:hypothetical protein Hamer_G017284 [Homarus americanus]